MGGERGSIGWQGELDVVAPLALRGGRVRGRPSIGWQGEVGVQCHCAMQCNVKYGETEAKG